MLIHRRKCSPNPMLFNKSMFWNVSSCGRSKVMISAHLCNSLAHERGLQTENYKGKNCSQQLAVAGKVLRVNSGFTYRLLIASYSSWFTVNSTETALQAVSLALYPVVNTVVQQSYSLTNLFIPPIDSKGISESFVCFISGQTTREPNIRTWT